MNCKPGDLAMIVKDEKSENLGKLVRVIGKCHLCEEGEWLCEALCNIQSEYFYTGLPYMTVPGEDVWIYDNCLRPIRGNDEKINSTEKVKEKA